MTICEQRSEIYSFRSFDRCRITFWNIYLRLFLKRLNHKVLICQLPSVRYAAAEKPINNQHAFHKSAWHAISLEKKQKHCHSNIFGRKPTARSQFHEPVRDICDLTPEKSFAVCKLCSTSPKTTAYHNGIHDSSQSKQQNTTRPNFLKINVQQLVLSATDAS